MLGAGLRVALRTLCTRPIPILVHIIGAVLSPSQIVDLVRRTIQDVTMSVLKDAAETA